jgi:hypothetical protein
VPPPAQPLPDLAAPPVAAPQEPTHAAAQLATTQPLEKQVAELQSAVAELQTEIAAMRALMPAAGDYFLFARSPSPGVRCDSHGASSANDFIQRAGGLANLRDPFPDGTLVHLWSGCRRD